MSHDSPGNSRLLKNHVLRTILLSGAFLQCGIWVRNFAILLFVMDKTNNDPYAVSLISVAQFAPIFVFSFIGGTFADRWPPRKTMVISDLLSALSLVIVLLALLSGTWKAIFFATLASATLSQFSQPAGMKLIKIHVPAELLQAGMAMFQTMMAVFMMIGPMLGTMLYQNFGITAAIGVMVLAFLLSAFVLRTLPRDEKREAGQSSTSFWTEIADGFRYVWSKPILRRLGGVFALCGFASGLIQPLFIFLVVERLGLPKEYLQWLMMINGAAMLVGGGVVMRLAKSISPQKLLAIGLLASTVGTFGNSLAASLWAVMLFQLINGLFFPAIHVGINTLILRDSEAAFVGRVNGVLSPLFMGMMVIAMSLAGWLKTALSLTAIYQTSAALFLISVLIVVPLFKHKLSEAKSV